MNHLQQTPRASALDDYAPQTPPEYQFPDWLQKDEMTSLRQMLALGSRPGMLSFALGQPSAEFFPREAYADAVVELMKKDPLALQYGVPFQPLKQHVARLMAERGVACDERQVFLTSGAQQGVSIVARLLLERGRQLVVEETTYPGLPIIVRPYQPEILTVPSDPETGIDVEALEALLESGVSPAFIYTMSDGHNPLGTSMSVAKRERLVALARRHRVPVVEDDVYGFLYYGDAPAPALRALDPDWVFYLGSFSKMLGPSLRTGWMVVPEALMSRLSVIKDMSDIDTCTISQRAIAVYLESGQFNAQLDSVRREYRARRDLMMRALEEHFPPGTRWSVPGSGVFIWVELPGEADTTELFRRAVEREQVAFFPGAGFCLEENRRASRSMRMNFTNCARDQIEEGIRRLARVIAETPR